MTKPDKLTIELMVIGMLQRLSKIAYGRIHTDDGMAAIYAIAGEAISCLLMGSEQSNKHSLVAVDLKTGTVFTESGVYIGEQTKP